MIGLQSRNTGRFMELATPPEDNPPAPSKTLQDQLREMYGRAAYTHKTHEKMADGYVTRYRVIKTIEIALSALATGSLLW